MANTVDRNALLDELKKLQGELDNNNLGGLAATAKKLAGEEDLLNLDSDPAIVAWQPSRPGSGTGGVNKIPILPPKTKLDLSQPTVSAGRAGVHDSGGAERGGRLGRRHPPRQFDPRRPAHHRAQFPDPL